MMEETRLQLVFTTSNNKTYTLYVDYPILPPNEQDVKAAMEELINANIIEGVNGTLTGIKEANIITKTVTPIVLE